jgi:hypothetical protein
MAQDILNQTQVNGGLQEMRGVRMTQRVHMRSLLNPTSLPGVVESALHTATRHRAAIVGQTMSQAVARGGGKQPHG